MPLVPVLRALLFAVGTSAAAFAAELVVKDVGLSLSVLPTAFDYELETGTLTRTSSDAFTSGTSLALTGRYGLARPGDAIGLVVGGELATDTWTYDGDGILGSLGLRVSAGLGWAITDNVTLLVEPGVRYGVSTFDVPGTTTSGDFGGSGTCSGFDARMAALWQIRPGLLLSAHGGWLAQTHELEDDDISLSLDQSGLVVGLGLTWRWSTAPARIE